jgi:hypothetical protein
MQRISRWRRSLLVVLVGLGAELDIKQSTAQTITEFAHTAASDLTPFLGLFASSIGSIGALHRAKIDTMFTHHRRDAATKTILLSSAAIAGAIATTVAWETAHAASRFDGSWTVQIITRRGACDPSSSFGVEIHDGVLTYAFLHADFIHEPDTLALLGALLWHGARCARVEVLARQRLSLSQGHAAEYELQAVGRPIGRPFAYRLVATW